MNFIVSKSNQNTTSPNNDQNPWIRGITRGSPYVIPQECHAEVAQRTILSTNAAKVRAQQWIQEAILTNTNISKPLNALAWTVQDIAEVASQSNQLALVNLERERTIWHVQCCTIIRKVTKNILRSAIQIAKSRINPQNSFQKSELERIETYYLGQCSKEKGSFRKNIEGEEARSKLLKQHFLEQVSLLLTNPAKYESIAIRDTTKSHIELTFRNISELNGIAKEIADESESERCRYLAALDRVETQSQEDTLKKCEKIALDANRVAGDIFLRANLHIRWGSTSCRRETR